MSDSSFIPERQTVFSPALAATIGLEEAILLQHLGDLFQHRQSEARDGYEWLRVERQWLLDTLPFWSTLDLHRISKSLVDKGVLLISTPPLHESEALVFAINQASTRKRSRTEPAPRAQAAVHAPVRNTAKLLAPSWTPSEDLLSLLEINHSISRQFALEQLEDFVLYWRERGEVGHAWDNKFRQQVLSRWRQQQQHAGERFAAEQQAALDNAWYPSADAIEIMLRSGVNQAFIDDAIPEFVLYWREHGKPPKSLNSTFISHIRRQWARYTSALSHDTEPQRIPENWVPTDDVFDILRMSHIDEQFARDLLSEFILYWRDSNQLHSSWNTKFLQHIKYKWAHRHQYDQDRNNGKQQRQGSAGSTRARSLSEDLSDRSWAG